MLLAVEGGGFFSASASGYSKGLTLLFSGDKDGDRPMRVVPWNQYQVVDQEADPVLQLDSVKNRVSRGCAASFSCFGGASAGLETPSPLKVEPVQQQQHEASLPESVAVSEKGKDHISEAEKGKDHISEADNSSKEAFKLSLRSSLKMPSVAESRSLEDIKEYETLSVDASDLTGDMARRKVQWPDACGSELTQVREFEPSEMGLSDEEWEMGRQRTCSCVIMVDVDEYVVKYKSALDLIEHLRAMGETNALLQRNKILNRETALATAAIYDSMFATEDGTIPATFQVIYMTGWREHSSHPQAKRRGSATVSFTDLQKQFGGQS